MEPRPHPVTSANAAKAIHIALWGVIFGTFVFAAATMGAAGAAVLGLARTCSWISDGVEPMLGSGGPAGLVDGVRRGRADEGLSTSKPAAEEGVGAVSRARGASLGRSNRSSLLDGLESRESALMRELLASLLSGSATIRSRRGAGIGESFPCGAVGT